MVDKCSLIHRSKLAEVEQLIYYLQQRRRDAHTTPPRPHTAAPVLGDALAASSSNLASPEASSELASIARLEDYVELLYENIPEKVSEDSIISTLPMVYFAN